MISALLPFLASLLIGFACGYAVRELIARRRRAAAREKFYRENPHCAGNARGRAPYGPFRGSIGSV